MQLVALVQPVISLMLGLSSSLSTPLPDTKLPSEAITPAQMIERTKIVFGAGARNRNCNNGSANGQIVVCGRRQADPRYDPPEPPPPAELKTIALGAPPVGKGAGIGVTVTGCFLQKSPKTLYFIDFTTLPEAPPGSDADKIAKGLMPAH